MISVVRIVVRALVLLVAVVVAWAGSDVLLFPEAPRMLSSAVPYAVFHLIVAAVGVFCSVWSKGTTAPWFALGFGTVDLYQAIAAAPQWFPALWFEWTPADTLAHWVLGLSLIVIGALALLWRRP